MLLEGEEAEEEVGEEGRPGMARRWWSWKSGTVLGPRRMTWSRNVLFFLQDRHSLLVLVLEARDGRGAVERLR